MKLKILSLNLRIWTKHKNPCDKNFWLKRTCQQAALFDKYDPDIICLQERIYPVGQELLGLNNYKVFGNRSSRLPIFIKKSFLKKYDVRKRYSYGGTSKENGHGNYIIGIYEKGTNNLIVYVQNSHLSWEVDKLRDEFACGFLRNTIFCGDCNGTIHTLYKRWKEFGYENDFIQFYYDEGDQPTYISYKDQTDKCNLDHFGHTPLNGTLELTHQILPEYTSDHFPILANIKFTSSN